jgi:DNA-binding CsgD family transcriptional regulator
MEGHDAQGTGPAKGDQGPGVAEAIAALTYIERRVLLAMSEGLSRREIASQLRISPRTVGMALTVGKEKLAVRSITAAVVAVRMHEMRLNRRS